MKNLLTVSLCTFAALLASGSFGEQQRDESEEIEQLFAQMTRAWQAGDGVAWGAAFLPHADFTVWFGLELEGRPALAEGHQFIFDRFYAGTSYEFDVRKIRRLSSDAAVVHLSGSVVRSGESLPDEPDTVPMAVVVKTPEGWKIAAFHNTPFAVSRYGRDGDIRKFKDRDAASQP